MKKITLSFDETWEYTIAGEKFTLDATAIPAGTWIAIVKDRLLNKGRDTWADSSKVTPENTRQDLWKAAMQTVYDGSWVPSSGKGSGQRRKSLPWEAFLHNESLKEAKRRIGKTGFKGMDGYHFKPNDEASLVECANRLDQNAKWMAKVKIDYDNLHDDDDLAL